MKIIWAIAPASVAITEALQRLGLHVNRLKRCGAVVLIQLRGTPRPECRIRPRYNPHTFFYVFTFEVSMEDERLNDLWMQQ